MNFLSRQRRQSLQSRLSYECIARHVVITMMWLLAYASVW